MGDQSIRLPSSFLPVEQRVPSLADWIWVHSPAILHAGLSSGHDLPFQQMIQLEAFHANCGLHS